MWSGRAKDIFCKLEPLANKMGFKIVELDLPTGQNGVFRVYLDTLSPETRISLDECGRFSPIVSDFSMRKILSLSATTLKSVLLDSTDRSEGGTIFMQK